jgi:hypothetical protein
MTQATIGEEKGHPLLLPPFWKGEIIAWRIWLLSLQV